MEPDFSGYATKAGLKCTDGRMITPEAFKHMDGQRVPLVWQHGHDNPDNVLGHVNLEARSDGMYCYAFFNTTPNGKHAKTAVEHGDVDTMSVWANGLVEKVMNGAKQVLHGAIREVSLVLAGANPGAKIDYVRVAHSDGDITESDDEAFIFTGLPIVHGDITNVVTDGKKPDLSTLTHADDGPTAQDIFDTLNDDQKKLFAYMMGVALEENGGGDAAHSDLDEDADPKEIYNSLTDQQKLLVHSMMEEATSVAAETATAAVSANAQEGIHMRVFDQSAVASGAELRHAAMLDARSKLDSKKLEVILTDAQRLGSYKDAFLEHAEAYGIENIDLLFPDARMDGNGVSLISRRTEWVAKVLDGTKHSPFARIKSLAADITADEARAKGYVKGNLKKDEIIKLLRRVTTPKTIYKKQKLDRDDIVDITDLDVVAWLKGEMRLMLDEELARAVLMSDGRDADDEDKIDEEHIRPIAYDVDMYNTRINLPTGADANTIVDTFIKAKNSYKGTGRPSLYTTQAYLTTLMLSRDTTGRRMYNSEAELASALMVSEIVAVEAMEENADLVAIMVNLVDYTIGADRGGEVSMFDDFDIDFNQQKYLIETRVSGALTKPKSAVTIFREAAKIVTAQAPTFTNSTGVVVIPTVAGVVYSNADTGAVLAAGNQPALNVGQHIEIEADPAPGYGLTHGLERVFEFTRTP